MPSLKELDNRLKSVRNTKKTTYAMKLVSAAKLRRAQEAAVNAREYTNALVALGDRLLDALPADERTHPLMEVRAKVSVVRIIAAGGNRGLCGSYNAALGKALLLKVKALQTQYPGAKIEVTPLGKKVFEFCKRNNLEVVHYIDNLPEDAQNWPLDQICEQFEKDFLAGIVDRVVLVTTKFRSAISMTPSSFPVLPTEPIEDRTIDPEIIAGVRVFEPSAQAVWAKLIPQIVRATLLQGCLDAKAAEHGARMTAMDNATKNAGELIVKLQRTYNKVRQGRITAELLDIIGGAEALK